MRDKGQRWALAAMLAVMAVVGAVLAFGLSPRASQPGEYLPVNPVGYELPSLALPLLAGGEFDVAALRGKVVVVNFWASWCAPCRDEAPALAAAAEKWQDRGVVFIGVNAEDRVEAAREFVREYQWGYPIVVDPDGVEMRRWAVTGLPETFFVGADGRIAVKHIGGITAEELEQQLAALVG